MTNLLSTEKYGELLRLQETLNARLKRAFKENAHRSRPELGRILLQLVEEIVVDLNSGGFHFGRADYGGDTEFARSTQVFSDGEVMGTGVILSFVGFSVQVTWVSA